MKNLIPAGLSACIIAFTLPQSASAGILASYSSLTNWQDALDSELWLEDFSSFRTDIIFRDTPLDLANFTLTENGGDDFRNVIDTPPFEFGGVDGTTHASLFTNFGVTSVTMDFGAPIFAWGAEFADALDLELVDLRFSFSGGEELVSLPSNGFFGVVSDMAIESIEFVSRTNVEGGGGEGFAIDNVRAGIVGDDQPNPVPLPAPLALIGLGLLGLTRRTKRWSTLFP